ncbi:MAG: LURP-one-related family protein [Myxococcales bacterium]|nr:LURP-one-related family protein [Myxococcales bacterium]
MRYLMNQKLFALTDRFVIKNASDEEVGAVVAKAFSVGAKLTFTDVQGREVASIHEKILSWGPTYEIYRDGALAAVVKKKLFKLNPTFTVDVPGPDDLTVEGEIWEHEYFFVRDGKAVATVSKAWWTLADSYGVEVLDSEDHILVLASTVVIDLVAADEEKR